MEVHPHERERPGALSENDSGRRLREATTTNHGHDLVWLCDECNRPIADGAGWVTINYAEISAFRQAEADWEKRHPRSSGLRVFNLAELGDFPEPVRWHVWHRGCDPDIDSPDYSITVERIRTVAQLLGWSAHLMEKTWLSDTTWKDVLRRQAIQLERAA